MDFDIGSEIGFEMDLSMMMFGGEMDMFSPGGPGVPGPGPMAPGSRREMMRRHHHRFWQL